MTDITINQVELSNFQELLQYFIAHLEFVTNEKDLSYKKRSNLSPDVASKVNEIANKKCRTGQGYKNAKIQNQISNWCDFASINDNVIICCQQNRGNGYYTANSYLYWNANTNWKIIVRPDDPKKLVSKLIIEQRDSRDIKKELDVKDVFVKPINDKLKDFYKTFINVHSISKNIPNEEKDQIPTKSVESNGIPLNLILYGPPGTGKTYNTVNKALKIVLSKDEYKQLEENANKKLNLDDQRKVYTDKFKELKNEGRIEFITFHQSMSYEDFVEGIKPIPTTGGKNVIYKVMPGIFKQICEEAIKPENKKKNYVLIIDEINRGNVSQIFGELITLIEKDKRLGNNEELTVKLPYSSTCKETTAGKEEEFGVPNNLYIIGTMNTADRSVEALDTALRRRFSFEEMMPDYKAKGMDTKIYGHPLRDILWTINQRIQVLKGREQQIGHSYLMKCKNEEDVKTAFKEKIVPLLQEYFYGDYSQIALVLGEGFVKKETDEVKFAISDDAPENRIRYNLLTDEEWKQERFNLQDALEKMNIQECPTSEPQPTTVTSDEVDDEPGQGDKAI